MIAFEPFRSSVPKLPYISNTPHLQVYPTVVRDGHQPVPRFVINVRSALVSRPAFAVVQVPQLVLRCFET